MRARTIFGTATVAMLFAVGCGSDDGAVTSSDAAPVTLGQLDDVVITVAPDDLVGEPIRLQDIDDDGEVEIVEPTDPDGVSTTRDAGEEGTVTRIDATSDAPGEDAEQGGGAGGSDDGVNPLGGDDPEDRRMPDVVCMGLQDAQDEIQDRGVFFSKSVDATGAGRRQLFDRNWIVVEQDPEPGEPIGENEAVLSVVKTDEDNDC